MGKIQGFRKVRVYQIKLRSSFNMIFIGKGNMVRSTLAAFQ